MGFTSTKSGDGFYEKKAGKGPGVISRVEHVAAPQCRPAGSTNSASSAPANRSPYVEADPFMSDTEFDGLLRELIEPSPAPPGLADPSSPSARVGGGPVEGFENVAHRVRMMSVDNTYSIDDLEAWHERVFGGSTGTVPLRSEDRQGAISLRYESGRLVGAVTQGDGEREDLVTSNVQAIDSVPLVLADGAPRSWRLRRRSTSRTRSSAASTAAWWRPASRCSPTPNTARASRAWTPPVVRARRLRFCAHGRGEWWSSRT